MLELTAFSENYTEARDKFLKSAQRINASLSSIKHPDQTGPNNEQLFLDTAWIGEKKAKNVLVVGCGTHGIEGYSGSAAQTNWMNHFAPGNLDKDTALLFLHAHNPWGFAHALRFTEENVDLNRNFVDFSKPLPKNEGYVAVHNLIDHEKWEDSKLEETFESVSKLREEIGEQAFSDAFNGGQYTHSNGIFYGGVREQWSNKAFRRAIRENLNGVNNAAIIDFHSGIGPERGHVFLCFHEPSTPAYERARAWWGERAVNREGVTHKAVAKYQGLLVDAFVDMLPGRDTTAVVVEFGTLPRPAMQRASMAARWLWASNTQDSELRAQLMLDIREAFYPSSPEWRAGVLEQSKEIIDRAVAGLSKGA